jgi:hypothetical protein
VPYNFPTSGAFMDKVEVVHGPAGILGRLFLQAERATRDCGISLSFATSDELVRLNRANSDTWRPLLPIFDHDASGFDPECGFVLLGRDRTGDVVASQAARVYDWSGSDLQAEATSLRMFYGTRPPQRSDEICRVDAPSASRISGRVVFSGAGWYRPDFRKRGLASVLPRISRAYAMTCCATDFTISIIADAVAAGGMAQKSGYTRVESSVELVNSPVGTVNCVLVWMDAEELLGDLQSYLAEGARARTKVDAVVEHGATDDARVA